MLCKWLINCRSKSVKNESCTFDAQNYEFFLDDRYLPPLFLESASRKRTKKRENIKKMTGDTHVPPATKHYYDENWISRRRLFTVSATSLRAVGRYLTATLNVSSPTLMT